MEIDLERIIMQESFYIFVHLQHLPTSSAVAPADTLQKGSAGALPFAPPFPISENEHCPWKQKTHFGATWSRFSQDNKVEKRSSERS